MGDNPTIETEDDHIKNELVETSLQVIQQNSIP